MNETSNLPLPVPGAQGIKLLGEQLAATPVPSAAPCQAPQVLGTDPTRVVADLSDRHLRVSEASLRGTPARISKSSGAVHHWGTFALSAAR